MGGIFNLDSTFMKYANKFADLMFLNMITIIFCIPIFTIGASLTAMHTMVLKIYRDEESYVIKGFFKAFKENFKQATIMWLLYLVMLLVLFLDFWYIRNYDINIPKFFNYALIFITVLGAFSFTWAFILQSRYENKIINTLKNSLIIGASQFFYSIMMIILAALPIICLAIFTVALPVCFAFGMTLPALLQAMLYSRVFDRLEGVDRKALKAQQQEDDGWTVEELEENPENLENADETALCSDTAINEEEPVAEGQVDEEKVE